MENVALWHERDISHSSAERVILPDSFCLIDYMLGLMHRVVTGLVIDRQRMARRVEESAGQWGSQAVLLAMTDAGLTREQAYAIVQRIAMHAESADAVREALLTEPDVTARLSREQIESCFDVRRHTAHVHRLLQRAGIESKPPAG
jgi:adenylosuccinate lyase